jgi:hypothetical protein
MYSSGDEQGTSQHFTIRYQPKTSTAMVVEVTFFFLLPCVSLLSKSESYLVYNILFLNADASLGGVREAERQTFSLLHS